MVYQIFRELRVQRRYTELRDHEALPEKSFLSSSSAYLRYQLINSCFHYKLSLTFINLLWCGNIPSARIALIH
ncbi:hypothetical protein E2C01_059571 [Portunus trituberculatus]|uniref:Uncharacterized protein n=1 Tax=Portunus trituberculatus TaxID=210409 RepID=A0A5B7H852_PORTR|nr:hypothetical protein [Portunus trituberculatus]